MRESEEGDAPDTSSCPLGASESGEHLWWIHLVPACGAEVGSWRGPGEDVSRNYSHYLSKISIERWMQIREKHVQVQRKKNQQGNETCILSSQDILKSEIHLNYKKISIY